MHKGKILLVDDEKLIRWSLGERLKKDNYDVKTAEDGESALEALRMDDYEVVLLDVRLPKKDGIEVLELMSKTSPGTTAIMITASDDANTAVKAMKLGAFDYITKPINFDELKVVVEKAIESSRLKREVETVRDEKKRRYSLKAIIAESPLMKEVVDIVAKVAKTDVATVLLQGESGTGKDLIAKTIHYESARQTEPFMEVNCTALPETLLESELFGYEKGAFTDAKARKKGLLELADGGTVFLDEIGDMKVQVQVKLLGVIEEKVFRRLGGVDDIKVDVRVIAATNSNLDDGVREGRFREDLYYRLKVIPINVPPLRQRREDIPALVKMFLDEFNNSFRKNVKGVSGEVDELFHKYSWPGNVRELRNMIERSMILEETDVILPNHLPREIREGGPGPSFSETGEKLSPGGMQLKDVEKQLVEQALRTAGGNQTKASQLLGISRDAFRLRMKKYGLLER